MLIFDMKIDDYLREVSSKKSTPGGGQVAGIVALEGLSLMLMSVNFTISKKGYEDVQKFMIEYKEKLEENYEKLKSFTSKDSENFAKLMDILQNYRENDREERLQISYIDSMNIPYEIIKVAYQNMKISLEIIEKANKNLITDSLMGYILSKSSFEAGKLNVLINLKYIKDKNLIKKVLKEIEEMEKGIREMEREYSNLAKI